MVRREVCGNSLDHPPPAVIVFCTMRFTLAFAFAIIFPHSGLHADEEPEYDMEARRQSVVNLERHIEQRKSRLAELREDTKRLDARVEKRAEELVTMLTEIRDSKESKWRVGQLKMRTITGLRNWIETYQRRRSRILESLRQQGDVLPQEELNASIEAFDERIERRVAQILKLTASMGDHQDVKKYESAGGSYWGSYHVERSRISDDWRQNRRDSVTSDKTRRELIKAVEDAIRGLESQRAGIEDKLNNRKIPNAEREALLAEIGRVDGSLDRRKENLAELVQPQGGPSGAAVGRNKAHDIERLLEDAGKDLSEDIFRLVRSYDEFEVELNQTFKLSENLEARKEWLKEHDK